VLSEDAWVCMRGRFQDPQLFWNRTYAKRSSLRIVDGRKTADPIIVESQVIRLDLMLADYATVQGGKLFISGAGIDTLGASPAAQLYTVNFAVALIMKIPVPQTGKDHELLISIADSAGQNVVLQTQRPGDIPAVDPEKIIVKFNLRPNEPINSEEELTVPLAFQLYGLTFPDEGVYILRAEIDGAIKSLTQFRVIASPQRSPNSMASESRNPAQPVQRPPMTMTGRIEATDCDTGIKFSGSGKYVLPDLKMISKRNRVAIDIGDDVEVDDYGTIIE
jgi:hypothetical protein